MPRDLLAEAGYGDGGKPLNVEILSFEEGFDRIIIPYVNNLKRIGVNASLRRVDPAQYERRMKSFDFDMSIQRYALRLTPGIELKSYWGSDAAGMDGSFNLAGIKDPVVDALIAKVVEAKSRAELVTAARALDRVLRAGHYWVPQWYKAEHNVAFWDKFSRPDSEAEVRRGRDRYVVVRRRQSCEAEKELSPVPDGRLSPQAPVADHPDAARYHADQLHHHSVAPGGPGRAHHRAAHRSRTRPSPRASAAAATIRCRAGSQSQLGQGAADVVTSKYRGAQGLDPEFIKSLEKQFGFDKPAYERFFIMMKSYLTFDFGKSYFRDISVLQLIKEKLPVSISLGLWMMLITYLISIPLGIRKAVHDGEPFDRWTSSVLVIAYAVPGFLFAVLLLILFAGGSFFQWFPSRGLTSDNWEQLSLIGKVVDYFWHLTLPLIAMSLTAFTTMTFLTKNSFIDEIRKQYVTTARAKGLNENQVLYGHVFRNAMLLIIAGFPGAFISAFFAGAMLIETIFSLDGLGLLSFEVHREARLSRGVRHAVDLLADGPVAQHHLRLRLHPGRSAHRLREPGGLSRWLICAPSKRRCRSRSRHRARSIATAYPVGWRAGCPAQTS